MRMFIESIELYPEKMEDYYRIKDAEGDKADGFEKERHK